MDLQKTSEDIRLVLKQKREALRLSFVEKRHIYYMLGNNGRVSSKWPSVTKIIKNFHEPFDANAKSLQMAGGDPDEQDRLLREWKLAGEMSVNLGNQCHFELERQMVERCGNYKSIRQPEFTLTEEQITKSDSMISAGVKYLDMMEERGGVLLDTELVMGHPTEGYVGQCDNAWIMMNKNKDEFGFVFTDWKSNQKKNFEIHPYTKKLFPPFQQYPDNALGKYYLQIPLYGRLLLRMLEGTRYEGVKFFGGVIVLLRDNGMFEEYRVPKYIVDTVMSMNLKPYLK